VGAPALKNPEPVLEIQDLVSLFETPAGVVRAVDRVSLSVQDGRVLGIVGESGSGKTQTFFGVLGLSRGTPGVVSGRARIGNVDVLEGLPEHIHERVDSDGAVRVVKDPAWRRLQEERLKGVLGHTVAILFQDPRRSLVPYWTIGRHLQEVLHRKGSAPDDARRGRAAELLRGLGFAEPARVLQSYPEQLSGGEAQRAMLALTMAIKPRVLIADEPTTGLDTINQALALESIVEQHERHRMAIVLISHDLSVIDAMADDVLVMYAGRVVARAPAAVLRDLPDEAVHPYARELRESRRRRTLGQPIVAGAAPPRPLSPTGCAFQLRCELRSRLDADRQAMCATEAPNLKAVTEVHSVACWGIAT